MKGLKDDADLLAAKARKLVLAERADVLALDRDRPEFGALSSAITISKVDLPEPDGPVRPTVSPRPISIDIDLRIWTRAAPPPSDRLTSAQRNGRAAGRMPQRVVHVFD